ncbi:MAG: hypothetical protein JXQ75_16540 [Phycisphaerae bacterium]|nr:hypothetical protein [Phycisphaerae bacterium]
MDITRGDPTPREKLAPGRIDVVENVDRQSGEPDRWLRVFLLPEEGNKTRQAFFTPDEVLTAMARVAENREDIASPKRPESVVAKLQKAMNDMFDRFQK